MSLSKYGYGHYEREKQPFTVDQLFTLSRVLGRSVEWFLGLETELTDKEDRLLATFRGMSPVAQDLALTLVQAQAEAERKREG